MLSVAKHGYPVSFIGTHVVDRTRSRTHSGAANVSELPQNNLGNVDEMIFARDIGTTATQLFALCSPERNSMFSSL